MSKITVKLVPGGKGKIPVADEHLIIDLQYFGSFTYYKTLCAGSNIVFEQYDRHLKKSFGNRCIIAGANGKITLSIPLEQGRDQKTITKDIRIDNDMNWQKSHLRSIVSSYNSSPWFKFYYDELSALYLTRYDFLLDWNLACFRWSVEKLQIGLTDGLTTEFIKHYPPEWVDCRNVFLPGMDFTPGYLSTYQQVFQNKNGFIPGLSILDILFCEGPKKVLLLLQKTG